MREIATTDAVGQVLCHDLTQIIKDKKKGPAFRKGHIIREEDIPVLLSMGKDHIYVWERDESILHENEAADILYQMCRSEYMEPSEVKEGKIEIRATRDGLLKIREDRLMKVNLLGEMMIACRHNNTVVKKGEVLAGTRIIPLVIEKEKMEAAKEAAGEQPLLMLKPIEPKKAGIVTTGNEVFYGRIEDTFTPVVEKKFKEFGAEVTMKTLVGDDKDNIRQAILDMIAQGAEVVVCTGGMSVDPDDRTPGAIAATGAEVITYGAPVLPGAMMLLSYYHREGGEAVPVLGLPGCVMYAKRTIFDILLPRILADDPISKEEIASLGVGGLCLGCPTCTFPNCGFGKA
ncbi:molybdopterin-binding protein [Ruminococcus gauvreauii]|uniref:Molybdopterin molybdenumtransferase n=1 Tax=Ruminococcus gauvreauii TaxID=438033 RepID=A0ABY5VFJ4_9FIRM|nr:molybdopterin-binding protein [Ruminococcus gauvreauii]UWP58701.1 molybdopterin-binding protein [Ruminococcus gauvreauii]